MSDDSSPKFRFDRAARILKEARKKAHLSQKEVAQKFGGTQAHVSKIEAASDVRISTLANISRVLGYEVMLVPTALAPVVDAIIHGRAEAEPRALYSLDDKEE